MQTPAVSFIKIALDRLYSRTIRDRPRTMASLNEFRGLGVMRLEDARTTMVDHHVVCSDIELGYLLGLETARVLLETMPAATQAGVEL